MSESYSLADVAAATGNNGLGFGSEGLWIFALLILLFGGNFNGGNTRNGEAYATQADIQRAVDLDTLKSGQSAINDVTRTTTADIVGAVKDVAYNNLSEIREIQNNMNTGFANMQNCCCDLKSTMLENRYLSEKASMENAQKVLDAIATNRMADMQNQINQLQLAQAMCGVPKVTPYAYGLLPQWATCNCTSTTTTTT